MWKWIKSLVLPKTYAFVDFYGVSHKVKMNHSVERRVRYSSTPFPEYQQVVVDEAGTVIQVLCQWDE